MPNGFDSILSTIATAQQASQAPQSQMFQMAQNQGQKANQAAGGPAGTGGGILDWLNNFAFGGGALKTAAGVGEKAAEAQPAQSTDYLKQAIDQHMKSQQPLTGQKPAPIKSTLPDATKQSKQSMPSSKQANF